MHEDPGIGILEEFRLDFIEFWHQVPNKTFFFVLLGSWLLLFQLIGNSTFGYIDTPSLLRWMYNAYHPDQENPTADDGHGLIIPFVVLGLFWWKRKEILSLPTRTWWPGLVLVVLALMLHVVGYIIQQPRISIIGLFAGIYGFMGLAWGPQWLRASFFPFFLFAFCVPLGSLAEGVTFPLRLLVCQLVEAVSHAILAIDIIRRGTQLVDPSGNYQYEVAAACSGLRSLVAIFVMAIGYGFVVFKPWWKRALVVASAFPLAVLGNLVRMLLIVVAAEMGGQKAGTSVHDSGFFSMIPYVPAIMGLFWIGHLLGDRHPTAPTGQKSGSNVSKAP